MCIQDTVCIPIWSNRRDVVFFTIVDAADADWVNRWRWSLHTRGHHVVRRAVIDGRAVAVYLHRALMGLKRGDGLEVDHINRNGLDNRRSNLRIATRAVNTQNISAQRNKASRYRGVHWDAPTRKWRAEVQVSGKRHRLGRFQSEIDAANAAREARLRLMPFALD